ncbi:MAG: hypothetical protein HON90_01340, partial [Halobacteriovoraceae bacterium]|nr:hypothetical protein [Halobacteriovoraceae bacterium]
MKEEKKSLSFLYKTLLILNFLIFPSATVYADWIDRVPLLRDFFKESDYNGKLKNAHRVLKSKNPSNEDYKSAFMSLREAEKVYPEDYRVNEWRAALHYKKEEWPKAYKEYLLSERKDGKGKVSDKLLYNR